MFLISSCLFIIKHNVMSITGGFFFIVCCLLAAVSAARDRPSNLGWDVVCDNEYCVPTQFVDVHWINETACTVIAMGVNVTMSPCQMFLVDDVDVVNDFDIQPVSVPSVPQRVIIIEDGKGVYKRGVCDCKPRKYSLQNVLTNCEDGRECWIVRPSELTFSDENHEKIDVLDAIPIVISRVFCALVLSFLETLYEPVCIIVFILGGTTPPFSDFSNEIIPR